MKEWWAWKISTNSPLEANTAFDSIWETKIPNASWLSMIKLRWYYGFGICLYTVKRRLIHIELYIPQISRGLRNDDQRANPKQHFMGRCNSRGQRELTTQYIPTQGSVQAYSHHQSNGMHQDIQGVSKKRYFCDFLSYFSSRGRILLFHMYFGIRILSPFHLAIPFIHSES